MTHTIGVPLTDCLPIGAGESLEVVSCRDGGWIPAQVEAIHQKVLTREKELGPRLIALEGDGDPNAV